MSEPLPELYPPIEPYETGFLNVSGGHRLAYELCGNPAGRPVVFLHGGPGAGCNAVHRRFFDPAFYRIVLFDQRGAGRSTPTASIEENTTALPLVSIVLPSGRWTRWIASDMRSRSWPFQTENPVSGG